MNVGNIKKIIKEIIHFHTLLEIGCFRAQLGGKQLFEALS